MDHPPRYYTEKIIENFDNLIARVPEHLQNLVKEQAVSLLALRQSKHQSKTQPAKQTTPHVNKTKSKKPRTPPSTDSREKAKATTQQLRQQLTGAQT